MLKCIIVRTIKLYLLAGIITVLIVTGANGISSKYSSGTREVATVPSVFKPIQFILDKLF